MNTIIKTLFAKGENDGDVMIVCRDGQFRCHSFVLCHACPTLKTMYLYSLEENVQDGIALIYAFEYSTKIMKNLISLLYGCEDDENYYSILETGLISVFEESIKEYIKAKDYFGIKYGQDKFPFTFKPEIALKIVANLPPLLVFNSWREQLYEIVYSKIDELDLNDKSIYFLFSNPEMCKKVMEVYHKKINALNPFYMG